MSKTNEKDYQIVSSKGTTGLKLTLSGDLSLNTIKGIKDDLAAYLGGKGSIRILIKDASSIDLGFIQLIQSFVWSLLQSNNKVDVEFDLTADQQNLLSNAGIKLKF